MADGASDQSASKVDLYQEYTYFADSTQTLADRRQSATQLYLGVQTSIFGLMTFLLSQANTSGGAEPTPERINESLVLLPLFVVGLLICYVWYSTIDHYKRLISWRYQQLTKMEQELPGSQRMFTREWDEHFQPEARRGALSFSNKERWLPLIVVLLYLVYGLALLVV